jgi:hypothetical protein
MRTALRARRRCVTLCLTACVVLGAGCGVLGGQTGQDSSIKGGGRDPDAECDDATGSVIGADDASVLGFSASELLDGIADPLSAPFTWYRRNESTRVQVVITYVDGEIRAIRGQPDGEHPECDELEVDVELTLTTEDGLLDERVSVTLHAHGASEATVSFPLGLDMLSGSYDASEYDLSTWQDPELRVDVHFGDGGGFSGQLSLSGGDPNPRDDEMPVSASVAGWP